MAEKLGGTRAVLAYMLVLGFIAACFVPGMSEVKFAAIGTMATTGITFYFSNKATLDKPNKSNGKAVAAQKSNEKDI